MRFGSAKALVFDFDGTLVDSNAIKWKAFEACFDRFPDRREEILSYCRGNNHTKPGLRQAHPFRRRGAGEAA